MNIIPINESRQVSNYPHGFKLKTTATYSIEFKDKNGFRSVFQTVNPKTNRINKPKLGTYNTFMWLTEEDGIINVNGTNINSYENVNKLAKFVTTNANSLKLTPEQLRYLYKEMFLVIKMSASYATDFDKLKVLINKPVSALVSGINSGDNIMNEIVLDLDEIEKLSKFYVNQG